MPTPTETFYNMRKLNRIFLLIALAGLGSIIWLLARNYTQEWRDYQRMGTEMERFVLAQEIKLRREAAQGKIADREDDLAAIEDELAEDDKYQALRTRLTELKGESEKNDQRLGNVRAERDKLQVELERARQMDPSRVGAIRDELQVRQLDVDELLREKDRIDGALKQATAETAAIEHDTGYTEAKSALAKARKEWDSLQAKAAALQPNLAKKIRDAWLIDFFAPTQKVREVYLTGVQTDLVFSRTPTTDRCMTCHVNIDRPEFTPDALLGQMRFYLAEQNFPERLLDEDVAGEFRDTADARLQGLWDDLIGGSIAEGYVSAWPTLPELWPADRIKALTDALVRVGLDPAIGQSKDGRLDVALPATRSAVYEALANDAATVEAWEWLIDESMSLGFEKALREIEQRLDGEPGVADDFNRLLFDSGVLYYDLSRPQKLAPGVPPDRAAVMKLLKQVNEERAFQGEPTLEWSNALLAHPRLELFTTTDSPHPLSTMGCTVCHEGSGLDTEFFYAAHTPDSALQQKIWAADDMDDFEASLKPLPADERERARRIVELNGWRPHGWHEQHYWERPMLPRSNTEASCAKCHTGIYDIQAEAPRLTRGRELFSSVGCINCHEVKGLELDNRKVGPDLAHISDKTTESWTANWLRAPRTFRPSARMPHFFRRSNNSDPANIYRTEVEIDAVANYLFGRASRSGIEKPPGDRVGDPARGKELFSTVGCLACHTNLAHNGVTWLRQAMIDQGVSPEEADSQVRDMHYEDMLAWLLSNFPERVSRRAPELSRVGIKAGREWLYGWLRNPNHYSATSRMPSLRLTEAEAMDLASYLSGLKMDQANYARAVTRLLESAQGRSAVPAPGVEPKLDMARMQVEADQFRIAELIHRREQSEPMTDTEVKLLLLNEADRTLVEMLTGKYSRSGAVEMLWVYPNLVGLDELLNDAEAREPPEGIDLARKEQGRYVWSPVKLRDRLIELFAEDDDEGPPLLQRLNALVALYNELLDTVAIHWPSRAMLASEYGLTRGVDRLGADQQVLLYEDRIAKLKRLFIGAKAINHYGCFGCHNVPGFERAVRIGTELSDWGDKNIHKVDFAYFDPIYRGRISASALRPERPDDNARQWPWTRLKQVEPPERVEYGKLDWLFWKLRSPRIWDREKDRKPYELLKMPHFAFTEQEIQALQTFVISRREPLVSAHLQQTTTPAIPRGRQLVRTWNCVACHRVDANEPFIAQTFRFLGDRTLSDNLWIPRLGTEAPPVLVGEGARIQSKWLVNFFGHVETLRPALKVRMPTFPLSGQEKSDLVEFFRATVDHDRAALAEVLFDKKGALKIDQLSEGDRAKLRALFERVDNQLPPLAKLLPPIHNPRARGEIRDSLPKLSDRELLVTFALFFHQLYGGVEVGRPYEAEEPPGEQGDLPQAEQWLRSACLTCHNYAGQGSGAGTKGPPLDMSWRRLRRPWAELWTTHAVIAQPGSGDYPPVVMPRPPFVEDSLLQVDKPKRLTDALTKPVADQDITDADGKVVKQVDKSRTRPASEVLRNLLDYLYLRGPDAERKPTRSP